MYSGQVEAGKAGARREVRKETGLLGPHGQGEPRFLSSWIKAGRREEEEFRPVSILFPSRGGSFHKHKDLALSASEPKFLTFDYFLFHFLQLLPHFFQKLLNRNNRERLWTGRNSDLSLISTVLKFFNNYLVVCLCLSVHEHMPHSMCRGQRTA